MSDRPILDAPDDPPTGTDFFDLRAPDFPVDRDWDNRYECFTFEVPTTETRYIRRIDTLIGDARVLHHTVLIPGGGREPGEHGRCGSDNPLNLIYGWAPGQGALHFDEGGFGLQAPTPDGYDTAHGPIRQDVPGLQPPITGAGSGALPVGLPSLPKGLDSWQRGSWAQVAIGWVRHGPRSDFEVETQVAPKQLVPGRQWLNLPVHPADSPGL